MTGGVCGALPSCSGGKPVCVVPHSAEVSVQVLKEVLSGASVVLQEWQNNSYRMGDMQRLVREIKLHWRH